MSRILFILLAFGMAAQEPIFAATEVEGCDGPLLNFRKVSIPLDDYIKSTGLFERISKGIPITDETDILNPDPSKAVDMGHREYPFHHFALSASGKKMAVTFHNAFFPEGEWRTRSGHLFLADVNQGGGTVTHASELVLPNGASATNAFFLPGDKMIAVAGVWTSGKDELRSDMFLYDITGKTPKAVARLSDAVGANFSRIAMIDSPDRNVQILFAEHAGQSQFGKYSVIRLDLRSGTVRVLASAKMSRSEATSIEVMEYDDDRRGFMIDTGGSVVFQGSKDIVEIDDHGKVSTRKIVRRWGERVNSSGSAWLSFSLSENGTWLQVNNTLTKRVGVYQTPNLDYGQVTELGGEVLLYSERNHPHYREVLLFPNGKAEIVSQNRWIFSHTHPKFFAGTTNRKGDAAPVLEIIHVDSKN